MSRGYLMYTNYWDDPLAEFVAFSVQSYCKTRGIEPTEALLHPKDAEELGTFRRLKVIPDKWTLPGHLLLKHGGDDA